MIEAEMQCQTTMGSIQTRCPVDACLQSTEIYSQGYRLVVRNLQYVTIVDRLFQLPEFWIYCKIDRSH